MKQETVKVKPWAPSQGEYVVVNKSDYDKHPGRYELLDAPVDQPETKRLGRPPKAE